MTNLDGILKSRDVTLPTNVRLFKAMVFPVVMCGYKSWIFLKKLNTKEMMLSNCGAGEDSSEFLGPQRDQSWVFIGRTDVEAETPILWPPDAKS